MCGTRRPLRRNSDLLRRGVSCRIIEKSPKFAVGSRARGISPRTQEIFASIGVLEPLRAFAEPYLPTRFYDVTFPNPMMVSQEKTDAVLRQRLHELCGTVELDCALTGLRRVMAGLRHWMQRRPRNPCSGSSKSERNAMEFSLPICDGIRCSGEIGGLWISGVPLRRGFWMRP